MPCNHSLPPDYVGLHCIYCGESVARVEAEDGQLVLRRDHRSRYVAVVQHGKQRVVRSAQVIAAALEIEFDDADRGEEPLHQVLVAFQDPEEKLDMRA
ncbi:MAG TPA: hypothetical protein VK421_08365 [Pyrinomonadaceae bacterium]|nr:hypothetical protein [Pyrinomonadaceae bacterium]